MNKYEGNDNSGNPKSDYVTKLEIMTDDVLFDLTEQKIFLSAYAANNPRSDYHWQCDACYDECVRRKRPEIYDRAHKRVSQGA